MEMGVIDWSQFFGSVVQAEVQKREQSGNAEWAFAIDFYVDGFRETMADWAMRQRIFPSLSSRPNCLRVVLMRGKQVSESECEVFGIVARDSLFYPAN